MLFHPELETWRCMRCGRLLAKVVLAPGSAVEQVCDRCHTLNFTRVTESAIETGTVSRAITSTVRLHS